MRALFQVETLYKLGMWAISIALAWSLIGFGNLVIADLPELAPTFEQADFVDEPALSALDAQIAAATIRDRALDREIAAAERDLAAAEADTAAERDAFNAWLRTRRATGDPAQDPEVIRRTEALEAIRGLERDARASLVALQTEAAELSDTLADTYEARAALVASGAGAYQRALFLAEARVFGLRLLFTLPLLALAVWALRARRRSPLWPLWRGFVIFAAFAFFVELVPYLPSYGGYVHYGVGAVVTVLLGWRLILAARRHMALRAEAAQRSETERRRTIATEQALARTEKGQCPSCERTLRTTGEAPTNFCVYCGLRLFGDCWSCGTRRLVFYPFCMTCGAVWRDGEGDAQPPERAAQASQA